MNKDALAKKQVETQQLIQQLIQQRTELQNQLAQTERTLNFMQGKYQALSEMIQEEKGEPSGALDPPKNDPGETTETEEQNDNSNNGGLKVVEDVSDDKGEGDGLPSLHGGDEGGEGSKEALS